jgi:biopolymer transport protein ExbD
MKFRDREKRKVRANLDMTPVIDVVFQLVLFFMLSSTFVVQNSIPVELPQAEGSTQLESRDVSVTLTAPPDGPDGLGAVYVDNRQVAGMDQLGEALSARRLENPDIMVLIRADEGVPTGRTVEVLGVAYGAGIQKSLIAARPPREAP